MSKEKPSHPVLKVLLLAAVALFCGAAFVGCGNGDEGEQKPSGRVLVSWTPGDCSAAEPPSVVARVYNASYEPITGGGPWPCSAGEGTLDRVTAGNDRTVVLLAGDGNGGYTHRGEKRGLEVRQDEETLTFLIDLSVFAPPLLEIEDGIDVAGDITLSWEYVDLADAYSVMLAANADFQNPVIDETVSGLDFTPTNLTTGVLYYWKVQSLDTFGNLSAASEIRRFLFREPEVDILKPLDGELFSASDNIQFAGQAVDMNGVPLIGSSLVWESSLNGRLGAGGAFNLYELGDPPLSVGMHTITLTATDDEGYAGSASITLTIVAPD